MIPRIAALPVDERGYPVPFFVAWVDEKNELAKPGTGKPEFRAMDPKKLQLCLREKLCWVCGQPMGVNKAFILGPMCTVNRITSEPPSHLDCAEWSVKGCPFLTRPGMVRREGGLEDCKGNAAGVMIQENPGVMAIWMTRSYTPQFVRRGTTPGGVQSGAGILISVGDPTAVTWWREGRKATVDEILAAIDVGLPRLLKVCGAPEEVAELMEKSAAVKAMVQGGTLESIPTRG